MEENNKYVGESFAKHFGKQLSDEQWRAVSDNDKSYDGVFIYAVKTTGIFCRPSCKSKVPRRENVMAFNDASQAAAAGFRPCKRCKPTGMAMPDEEWISIAADYVRRHYKEPLTLQELADACHGTPYHFHRTFKKIKGVTPLAYMQDLRISRAKHLLATTSDSAARIGQEVGWPNAPYFITVFKRLTGLTPEAYRSKHKRNEEYKHEPF